MTNNEYIEIIKNQAPTPEEIKPVQKIINNRVENSSLFKVKQFGKTFIYKVSDSNTSFRNLMLAQSVLAHGVLVPDSKIFIGGGTYFEKYEIIPGTPLSVAILNNQVSNTDIENILHDTIAADKEISKIQINDHAFSSQLILHARRKYHNTKDFGKILAMLHHIINKKQTTYGQVALHHADLNPSNILLDEHGNFKALLDLDSLALCDEYTALSQILLLWPNISLDLIVETYESISGKKLNKHHLQNLMRFRIVKSKTAAFLRKIKTK